MGRFDIEQSEIRDDTGLGDMIQEMYNRSKATMDLRTNDFKMFTMISHNQSLYEPGRAKTTFSEGTTQALKRKIRAQTLQRVPDGDISTQFDKNSIEQVETEFLFRNKVLTSEFDGRDMLKNLWRAFNAAYDYGFACVRTGFEKDLDGDPRVSWTQIGWNDVYPAPDCDFIEEAEWYVIREYVSQAEIQALVDEDGEVKDKTYFADTVRFLYDWKPAEGPEYNSVPLADDVKGATKVESFEIMTLYRRGDPEFYTWVPSCQSMLRCVRNEDPRKDVPIHFLILEPDPEFPLGCSSVMWTLAQQQFADAFQTSAYQSLLLATRPPIMATGNLMNAKIKMEPAAFWDLGNNPNNKIEKFPVETTTLTSYGSILENVGANMMKNLNVTDQTIASDANVARYSGTAPGVHEQARDKTITINQYAKRVEAFFCEWANHALRSYINSMSGEVEMTVDEETRRRIWDIEAARDRGAENRGEEPGDSVIDGDRITVDFDALSTDLLSFRVRAGSLIETREEEERRNIQEMLVPVSQMMGNVSEENRAAFEQNIMQMMARLFELSNIDVSAQTAQRVDDRLLLSAQRATMEQVMMQQQQIQQLAQAVSGQPEQPQIPQQPPQQQIPQQQPLTPPVTGGVPSELNEGQQPAPIQ